MDDTTWFWEVVDAEGLADVPSDEVAALRLLIAKYKAAPAVDSTSAAFPIGTRVSYVIDAHHNFVIWGYVVGDDEGWVRVRFDDASEASIRPSRLVHGEFS